MGQLLVRDLDDEVIRRLKRRAALHGRLVEAEHRAIVEEAVRPRGAALAEEARRFQEELAGRVPSATPSAAETIRGFRDERSGIPS